MTGQHISWRRVLYITDFLNAKSIQVRIGLELSNKHVVESGTPQGSVRSHTLFSEMKNDIFVNLPMHKGKLLFADDGGKV